MIKPYSFGQEIPPSKNNNVIDKFKEWTAAEIRADLDPRRTQMVNIFENVGYNINIACGIRSNNAFLGNRVYVVGRRRFDHRGSVGTLHYEHCFSADTIEEVIQELKKENYTIFAVDNLLEKNPKNYWDVEYPAKSAFIYGAENEGISQTTLDLADQLVYINMPGSVRSMNVACAASCIMAEYSRQHRGDIE